MRATTFNYVTGAHERGEWDLTMSAVSPDTLKFEIFEDGHMSQWGEQTFALQPDGQVRVAEWSKAEHVDDKLTVSGSGRSEGYALIMDLEASDGSRLKSAHHFVHADRWIVIDDFEGQWRTVSVLERR